MLFWDLCHNPSVYPLCSFDSTWVPVIAEFWFLFILPSATYSTFLVITLKFFFPMAHAHVEYLWNIVIYKVKTNQPVYHNIMVHCSVPEKAMAPHSSTLAWKIPWTEEAGVLQSMGSLRVGHDWTTSLSLFTFMHWRRKWQPTPAFLPGESQGWASLVGCCLWGRTELDTTEAT